VNTLLLIPDFEKKADSVELVLQQAELFADTRMEA
jgi:hypothetical protein